MRLEISFEQIARDRYGREMSRLVTEFIDRTGVFKVTGGVLTRTDDPARHAVVFDVRFRSSSWTGLQPRAPRA